MDKAGTRGAVPISSPLVQSSGGDNGGSAPVKGTISLGGEQKVIVLANDPDSIITMTAESEEGGIRRASGGGKKISLTGDTEIETEGNTEGGGEVEGSDKDKKGEDVEKDQAKRGAVVRVSDTDRQEGRQQQEGFLATLLRQAEYEKVKSYQDLIDLAWKGDSKDPKFKGFTDIAQVYDGIRYAQIECSKSGDEKQQKLVGLCLGTAETLLKEKGPDIRAGWLFGVGAQTVDSLQMYRREVLRFKSVPETFNAIAEHVKGDSKLFERDINKLLLTIQKDMNSGESTLEPAQLREINDELFKVRSAGQTLKEVTMLYRDMNITHGLSLPQASEQEYDIVSHKGGEDIPGDYYSSKKTETNPSIPKESK